MINIEAVNIHFYGVYFTRIPDEQIEDLQYGENKQVATVNDNVL